MNDIRRKLLAYYNSLNLDDMKYLFFNGSSLLNPDAFDGFTDKEDFYFKYICLDVGSPTSSSTYSALHPTLKWVTNTASFTQSYISGSNWKGIPYSGNDPEAVGFANVYSSQGYCYPDSAYLLFPDGSIKSFTRDTFEAGGSWKTVK